MLNSLKIYYLGMIRMHDLCLGDCHQIQMKPQILILSGYLKSCYNKQQWLQFSLILRNLPQNGQASMSWQRQMMTMLWQIGLVLDTTQEPEIY